MIPGLRKVYCCAYHFRHAFNLFIPFGRSHLGNHRVFAVAFVAAPGYET